MSYEISPSSLNKLSTRLSFTSRSAATTCLVFSTNVSPSSSSSYSSKSTMTVPSASGGPVNFVLNVTSNSLCSAVSSILASLLSHPTSTSVFLASTFVGETVSYSPPPLALSDLLTLFSVLDSAAAKALDKEVCS